MINVRFCVNRRNVTKLTFCGLLKSNGGMDAVLPYAGFAGWALGSIGDHALFDDFYLLYQKRAVQISTLPNEGPSISPSWGIPDGLPTPSHSSIASTNHTLSH